MNGHSGKVDLRLWTIVRPLATFINNQAIKKISEYLVAAGLKIGVVVFTEYCSQLRFWNPEIHEW